MNILVVGRGAREHAIVAKCRESQLADRVYCSPGNAGIAQVANCVDIDEMDFSGLLEFAKAKHIDLTIVGPETPLVYGIVDKFEQEGLKILGPNKDAAIIEGSKLYAKSLMKAHGIPTANFAAFFDVDPDVVSWMAGEHIKKRGAPCVVKASALAGGKGVVVADTVEEALLGAQRLAHTPAGKILLVEDRLEGWECSYIILTDGTNFISQEPACDYKRLREDGYGGYNPNTGGMGAYSPVPRFTSKLEGEIVSTIVEPTLMALKKEGIQYNGFLYFGLMITESGPKVLEFNCRLGDPEAQVLLPRFAADFVDLCHAAAKGNLFRTEDHARFSRDALVNVVLCSPGYPGNPKTGYRIYGLEKVENEGAMIFHGGTARNKKGQLITSGGRVLSVLGRGATIKEAREMAYRGVRRISIGHKNPRKGKQWYREDIADVKTII